MSTNPPPPNAGSWFDPLYQAAGRDPAAIPWAHLEPNRWVLEHLAESPGPGRAVVAGCGLGDDAQAVAAAGYDTIAFDVSPTAIEWCRERFPGSPVEYRVADLLHLPGDLVGVADLVTEVRTIQSLPPSVRADAVDALASLLAPRGVLLVVARGRPEGTIPTGPPWPVSDSELGRFDEIGLERLSDGAAAGHFVRVYRAR